MKLRGRADEPWDALLIFHFLSSEGDGVVGDRLQKLTARKTSLGIDFDTEVTAGKRGKPFQLIGRFIAPDQCDELIARWNEPDGEISWMCYTPNHGLATVRGGELDWWTLICFKCENAGFAGPLALSERPAPNRTLPKGTALRELLIALLPDRPFSVRG